MSELDSSSLRAAVAVAAFSPDTVRDAEFAVAIASNHGNAVEKMTSLLADAGQK